MSFILMILLLLTAGAFFGAAETALTAASKPLMHQLEDQGDPRAKTVMALLERRERLISTMLLGNILSNTAAGALTTSAMIDAFGENGVAYATGIVTVIVVVYGEILPKTYALLNANSMSLRTGGIVAALVWICRPYTIAVEFFVNGALRLAGIATEQTITAQQILAELRGTIEMQMGEKKVKEEVKHERAMLRSVLDPTGVEVGEIIIHRKKVVTIEGIAGPNGQLHKVQKAMLEEIAPQCGFCTPGQVVTAVALLNENPKPTEDEVLVAMSGNMCRCGAYNHYLNAVMRASKEA